MLTRAAMPLPRNGRDRGTVPRQRVSYAYFLVLRVRYVDRRVDGRF